jgi:putative sigma-54 modulation protein
MKITISFLHLEHTPALDERIKEKSEKLAKYFKDTGTMKWSCFVKNGKHYAEVYYHASHFEYHATAHAEDMYHTIDIVLEKLEKQIYKNKEKYNKLHRKNTEMVILDTEKAWTDHDEDAA